MRAFLFMAAALLVAGCAAPGTTPTPTGNETNTTTGTGMMPAPINDTKQVSGATDPGNVVTGAPCQTPNSQCFRYPFTMTAAGSIVADLSWTLPASDFDLYVFQDNAVVSEGGANDVSSPSGTSEHVEMELEPGDYELVVVAWAVAQDTYKVSATFAST